MATEIAVAAISSLAVITASWFRHRSRLSRIETTLTHVAEVVDRIDRRVRTNAEDIAVIRANCPLVRERNNAVAS